MSVIEPDMCCRTIYLGVRQESRFIFGERRFSGMVAPLSLMFAGPQMLSLSTDLMSLSSHSARGRLRCSMDAESWGS